ncbi:MAG TPA: serine--tRNA ligase [Rhizomicrobium sp.]|nr:serine--tRNA ligase [Rhizomicrobium sp.]
MHDIEAIRSDPDAFIAGLKRRNLADAQAIADDVLAKDKALRETLTALQQMQARRNEASKLIGQAKAKKDEAQAQALMAEVSGLKEQIQKGEEAERTLKKERDDLLAGLPNIPASDVPDGTDETANVPVDARAFGEKPRMNFKPKEHFELGEALGLMDFERAAKVSGARFVYLKGALAKMERALGAFMLDLHTENGGYTEMQPPLLVRDDAAFGTGQLPKFEDDLFATDKQLSERERKFRALVESLKLLIPSEPPPKSGKGLPLERLLDDERNLAIQIRNILPTIPDIEKLWLIPTAEVSLTNYVREEILDDDKLPQRFTAHTPCFRAEAGAAGKDTRGMIRQHQFTKVELVSITTPEQSEAEHERMTSCAQEVLKRLNLHHRVVTLCTGDMGFTAKKTYDIEVWLPGQNAFREISSCSNCGDFQARRMNTRYRPKDAKQTRFVHTLNGSGLAVGRTIVAILENYQNEDGSITVPEALRPYMGGMETITR